MRGIPFGLGQLSASEKSDILNQHKDVYNGYQTMQPQVSNTQPLYTYDDLGDKHGMTVNNKGEVKRYTNVGINEQHSYNDDSDDREVDDSDMGPFGVPEKKEFRPGVDLGSAFERMKHFAKLKKDDEELREEAPQMCECGGEMEEGVCSECNYGHMDEETGHLDDIYNEKDLNLKHGDFDYVEGGGNDYGTFEKSHKKLYKEDDNYEDPDNEDDGYEDLNASEVTDGEIEELGTHELVRGKKYKYKTPSFDDEVEFDDEFEDKSGGGKMFKFKGKDKTSHLMPGKHIEDYMDKLEMEEQSGLSDYLDTDDMDSYTFTSKGPKDSGDSYSIPANDMDLDDEDVREPFNFKSGGAGIGAAYPVNEFEEMESAWADDELEESDVSGVQGIYGDMDPAYDFDSEGPGKAGPYQEFSYESKNDDSGYEGEDEDAYWDKDLDPDELDLDLTKFNPEDKSWEDIKAHTGDWDEIDEDLQESFVQQKNKIMEMMNRMKVIK